MKTWAGIGSRITPLEIQKEMTKISMFLYKHGYTLRSGGAKGADTAFEKGSLEAKEIFTPDSNIPNWAFKEIQSILPEGYKWDKMKTYTQRDWYWLREPADRHSMT